MLILSSNKYHNIRFAAIVTAIGAICSQSCSYESAFWMTYSHVWPSTPFYTPLHASLSKIKTNRSSFITAITCSVFRFLSRSFIVFVAFSVSHNFLNAFNLNRTKHKKLRVLFGDIKNHLHLHFWCCDEPKCPPPHSCFVFFPLSPSLAAYCFGVRFYSFLCRSS